MMKRALRFFLVPISLACIITTFSCSDSEHRIPFGATKVVINLNLPKDSSDTDIGILERIRRFLVPDALAQTAPAAFSSILVRVTGPDIAPIERSFGPYGTISLSVPAGYLRNFEVIAYVAPDDPSAAASFHGTASANCPAGSTVSVPVVMMLNETRIVLPDPGPYSSRNERIIQMNDITGEGMIVRTGVEIGFPVIFMPWEIDFDARGRIYIATNDFGPDSSQIIRMNTIADFGYEMITNIGEEGFVTLAIDRPRGYIYFATPYELRRCNTSPSSIPSSPLPVTGIDIIISLSVADNGILYIAGQDGAQVPGIYIYDPVNQVTSIPYTSPYLARPEDVMVRGSSVYVANPDGPDDYKIIELDRDLQFVAGYGTQYITLPDMNTGRFYGPRRFVAIRNDELFIIDDLNFEGNNFDKLVSMSGLTGANWKTFPLSGDGQAYFKFFYGS